MMADGNLLPAGNQVRAEPRNPSGRFGFFLVIAFLLFEYGRPQDMIPVIGELRPTWILNLLMVISWSRSPKLRSVWCPQLTLSLLMLALLLVHVPFATNYYWAFQTAVGLFVLIPFCVSTILFVDSKERLISFMRWWALLALYTGIKVLVFGRSQGGSSFLGDQNDVALLMNVMLPFVLFLLVYERAWRLRLGYLFIAAACVAAIVTTTSRGGFVGLLAVCMVVWLLSPRKVLTLVVLGILLLGVYNLAPQSYWDRMQTITATNEGTAKGRMDSWMSAWAMFKDHPLGVGGGNFPILFPEYQSAAFGAHNMWGRAAHSLWFTLLAELGIPGAILYALLLRANCKSLWHLYKAPTDADRHRIAALLSVAFLAGFTGYFASGTFLSVLFYPHYWCLSALLVASDRSLTRPLSRPVEPVTLTVPPRPRLSGPAARARVSMRDHASGTEG